VHVYDSNGNKAPATAEIDKLLSFLNTNATRLFAVESQEEASRKGKSYNPADEVDRRVVQYRSQHPNASHHDALHAVLDADAGLKADYAQAG
jgi:hypothetical protein